MNFVHGAAEKFSNLSEILKSGNFEVDVISSSKAIKELLEKNNDILRYTNSVYEFNPKSRLRGQDDSEYCLKELFQKSFLSESELDLLKECIYESKIKDNYDIIFSFFAETASLKKLFTNSKVLFFETGLFCHMPFREFQCLDPFGTYKNGSYIEYSIKQNINKSNFEYEKYEIVLESIKETILKFSEKFSPQVPILRGLRAKRKCNILLALQPLNHIDYVKKHSSNFDIIEFILNELPNDIGLIVSEHPFFPEITHSQNEYLKKHYSNYIYDNNLQNCYSASTLCLPYVDALISVGSSVIFQGYALGIRVHNIGSNSFSSLNNETSLQEFISNLVDQKPYNDRKLEVLNLIARFSIPKQLYYSSWIISYLNELIDSDCVDLPLISTPEALFEYYKPLKFPETLYKSSDFFTKQGKLSPISVEGNFLEKGLERNVGPNKHMMTIAVILDHFGIGGTQNVVNRLIKLLPNIFWVVFVEKRISEEYEIAKNVDIVSIGTSTFDVECDTLNLVNHVGEYNESLTLDIFLNPMHWREYTLKAMPLLKERHSMPVIYWEHNSFYYPLYNARHELHVARSEVIEKVDKVVLLSPYDKYHFDNLYDDISTVAIQNPVPNLGNGSFDISKKEKIILVVGRFDPQKRMDRIIPIMKIFSKKYPDWKMVVLGDGFLKSKVEKQVIENKLEKYVDFLGHQMNTDEWYSKASIFALLSDYEGDPLTLMEAKAYGVPIVSFELFQNTRLRNNIDGFYVDQGNYELFSDKLGELVMSKSLRRKMGYQGFLDFQNCDNKSIGDEWIKLFSAVVSGQEYEASNNDIDIPPDVIVKEAIHVNASCQYFTNCMHEFKIEKLLKAKPSNASKTKSEKNENPVVPKAVSNTVKTYEAPNKNISYQHSYNSALEAQRIGDFARMYSELSMCLILKPENPSVRRKLFESLIRLGRKKEALEHLRYAQKILPNNKNLKYRLLKHRYPYLFFWKKTKVF